MSIEESLKSLREIVSYSRPLTEQVKMIDTIMSAYKIEFEELAQLKKEHSILRSEYEQFKTSATEEISALKAENAQLKPNPSDRLEDICEIALKRVANMPHEITKDEFLTLCLSGVNKGRADYYFDLLHGRGLVAFSDLIDSTVRITSDGRRYLVKFGLI